MGDLQTVTLLTSRLDSVAQIPVHSLLCFLWKCGHPQGGGEGTQGCVDLLWSR